MIEDVETAQKTIKLNGSSLEFMKEQSVSLISINVYF
jgi:hypothetical protein